VPPAQALYPDTRGTGIINFFDGAASLTLVNSVAVALRQPTDPPDQWRLYVLFGLNAINIRAVPTDALVLKVEGVSPTAQVAIELPSPSIQLALHTGFNQALLVTQAAASVKNILSEATEGRGGFFILEPFRQGEFFDEQSRQVRLQNVTLRDPHTGVKAVLRLTIPFTLTSRPPGDFLRYVSQLGLDVFPTVEEEEPGFPTLPGPPG